MRDRLNGPARARSFADQLIHGSAWMIGMRWALRLTGLVSTAILARLLMPSDFGIVAMATVFAGLLDTAAYTGVDLALIRSKENTPERMNSAWTIQLIQALVVAMLLAAVSPFAAWYFHEPRVMPVILWLAVRSVLDGLQNIGIVEFRRNLDFAKEFRFNLYAKVLNLAIVIGAAYALRNYLALVIGLVSSSMISLFLSYRMHPYRPRLALSEARHLWSFSNWLLVSRIGTFLSQKSDEFIVGGAVGSTPLGRYHIAAEIATIPTVELVMPLRRALFPTLSGLQHDGAKFSTATLQTFGALATLCFSLGFGMHATAREAVALVLGEKWLAVVPLVQWLALYGAFAGLASVLETSMWVSGKTHVSAIRSWVEFGVLVPLLIFAVRRDGVEGAAIVRAGVSFAVLPMMLWLTSSVCPIRLVDLVRVSWRALASAILMAFVVETMPFPASTALALIAKVSAGALVFSASLLVLWVASGRPSGFESVLLARSRRAFARPARLG